ncbi:MAG TPA: hypothetical protein VF331_06275 [Polyangiales bacterium]
MAIFTLAVGLVLHAACFGGITRPLTCTLLGVLVAVDGFVVWRSALRRDEAVFALLALVATAFAYVRDAARWQLFGDNIHYIRMATEGLHSETAQPFASRWLTPLLAGGWNITPCVGWHALSGFNFACLAVAFFGTAVVARRLSGTFWAGILAIFVLSLSEFARYAAYNRLLTDPANYALHALIAVLFLDRRRVAFAAALLLAALNSEKVLVLCPLAFALSLPAPRVRALVSWLLLGSATVAPAALVLVLRWHAWHGQAPVGYDPDGAAALAAWPPGTVYFPFMACTVPALLSLLARPGRTSLLGLTAVAAFVQVAFASDTERMTAYAFVCLVPFAARFFADTGVALSTSRHSGELGLALGALACVALLAFDSATLRVLALVVPLAVQLAVWLATFRLRLKASAT